jgi:hypothetical protein
MMGMSEATRTPAELSCTPLEASQIEQVFPLVRDAMPELDLPEWRRRAAELVAAENRGRCGLIGVRGDAGYFCGLAIFHIEPGRNGTTLIADHFIAYDVLDRTQVSGVLLAGLDALARQLGCIAVETSLTKPRDRLVERFRAAGHNAKLVLMSKQLDAEPRQRRPS